MYSQNTHLAVDFSDAVIAEGQTHIIKHVQIIGSGHVAIILLSN